MVMQKFLQKRIWKTKKRKGFTLVELGIVVLVIVILVGAAIAANGFIQESARRTTTKQDLKTLQGGVLLYELQSKNGQPPDNLGQLVSGLAANETIDGEIRKDFVVKANWTSDSDSFVDSWGNKFIYDKSNRTITSTNGGKTSLTVPF